MSSTSPPPISRTAARARDRASRKAAGPAKQQLTPKDWIDAATELLVRKSVDAINVDPLAKSMGVTRGSFYWHFSDREDLLTRMLESWRDSATQQVIGRFERQGVTPRELVAELLDLPFRGESANKASSIELAIRAWARRDEIARHAVDAVDAQRLSYIAQCFTALDFSIAEARARSFMLYAYLLAESLVAHQAGEKSHRERQRLLESLLLNKPGDPE